MIGILIIFKWLFKNILSSRMQYNLWFFLLGLLAVPFMPFRPISFTNFSSTALSDIDANNMTATNAGTANWMNDFTISVNRHTPSSIGYILFTIWLLGIFAMVILTVKSILRLLKIENSALLLQNPDVCLLYRQCLNELMITRNIPVYSTAFLKSPIMLGFFKPRIYLPIHLICDYRETDVRYMLLHELQHYKHKDAAANFLMTLVSVVYWFNPLVWYALKEMRNDREVACDTSVLKMLEEDAYADYGNTLINFAQKVSVFPFPFASGLSGSMKQMKRRIINIASYKKPSFQKTLKGMTAFLLIAVFIMGFTPFISTYAADTGYYRWNFSSQNVVYEDYSNCFGKYNGSFVLYDITSDQWTIYNKEQAVRRFSPDSTFKIYSALFCLNEKLITPYENDMKWDHTSYPFAAWEADQNLNSAMASSVNWYFNILDNELGIDRLSDYLHQINYGNQSIDNNTDSFWLESTLAISPIEQVQLLTSLYDNTLPFSAEDMNTVKNSIHIASSDSAELYGKTGTGRVNGKDINGWFIGYVTKNGHTYVFATNIQADSTATGTAAADITFSILSMNSIYE